MKKLASIAFVALFTISTFAQRQQRENLKQHFQESEFTIDQMAELKTKKMTLQLDLSEQQQQQLLEINKTSVAERRQKMEARKAAKGSDKALSTDEIFKIQQDRLDKMIAHKAEMKALLNSEQYIKWEKTVMRRGHHVKKKRGKQHRFQKRKRR